MNTYKLKYYSKKETTIIRDLTGDEYENIVIDKVYIYFFLHVEELYEIFKINVFEFWKYLLEITETHRLNNISDYDELLRPRLILNQRLANILTSFKSYEDLIKKSVSHQFNNNQVIKNQIKNLFSQVYDKYFEYRFFCKLRDFMQHYDLPIAGVNFESQMINPPSSEIAFTTNPYLMKEKLLQYKKWGPIRKEIETLPDKVLLKIFLNEFLLSINVLHKSIRTFLFPKYNDAKKSITNFIHECEQDYFEKFKSKPEWTRVYSVKCSDGGTPDERWLPDDVFDRIEKMLVKNSLSENVQSSFTTMQQLSNDL